VAPDTPTAPEDVDSTLLGFRNTAVLAVAIAAAAVAAGPILGTAPAYAARTQMVNFTGGMAQDTAICTSKPSQARVAVVAESRVMFANRLRRTATLRIDGQPVVSVEPDQAVPVIFHYGPVSVSMTFACDADAVQQFSAAAVSVTSELPRVTSASDGVAPEPTDPVTSPLALPKSLDVTGGQSNRDNGPAPAAGGATDQSDVDDRPATASSRQGTQDSAASGDRADPRGAPATGRAPATRPPGNQPPAASESDAAGGTPPGGTSAGGTSAGGTASGTAGGSGAEDGVTGASSPAVAIEPLVPAGMPQTRTPGLLALLAAVCAVGVTIATTRVIISKRTIQTPHA
jgi:uncharacterized membrane protein YgcG